MNNILSEVTRTAPLAERAYEVIKSMIVQNTLLPGQLVPESVLAKELKISRSPVKSALTRLQDDGLIVGEAWKVMSVSPLDAKYVDNVYQVRKALEAQCAIQAIGNIPRDKIEELGALLAGVHPDADLVTLIKVADINDLFHKLLRQYCDNDLLKVMLLRLSDHILRIRNDRRFRHHEELLRLEYWALRDEIDALRTRDAPRLASTLVNQADRFRLWIIASWDSE
jgi:DNA-binding GntR family transcriptional regulator